MTVCCAKLDHSCLVQVQTYAGLKDDWMWLGWMDMAGLTHLDGKTVEQEPEENQEHWEEVCQRNEQFSYDCCGQLD